LRLPNKPFAITASDSGHQIKPLPDAIPFALAWAQTNHGSNNIMQHDRSLALAFGGLAAMTAALGIGRFVYTPILPAMLGALGWSKSDAGLVASANLLGYFIGALLAGRPFAVARPRPWLLAALTISAVSTAAMALPSDIVSFVSLRFIGGVASAFVIVCASTLVLERLSASGRGSLSAVQFAGVGFGIMISAITVSVLLASGAGWRSLWIGTGSLAVLAAVAAAALIPAADQAGAAMKPEMINAPPSGMTAMVVAYGLFGFGYIITATFLVAIVRLTAEVRVLEPWVWTLFGLAAIPSVTVWSWLGQRVGILNAFAAACAIEAVGVAVSVEWVTIPGICLSALLLGGTFMGLTVLGFLAGRMLSSGHPHRAFARMTASFSIGQMIGPTLAGFLSERLGDFRVASLIAAAALVAAAALALRTSWAASTSPQMAPDTAARTARR
jgi:predicted MFS family arabinose efflux permease